MEMQMTADRADLLYGVSAIASFMGIGEKACRHKCEAGIIPTFKIGGRVCSRRSDIAAWIAALASEALHGERA